MARIRSITGETVTSLERGWQMALGTADILAPEAAEALVWHAAPVPGTAAQALEHAGVLTAELAADLQSRSIWYRTTLSGPGPRSLRGHGLATLCDIWLDGVLVGTSESMFLPLSLDVILLEKSELYLHFKPLTADTLPKPSRRQRWRPHLIADPHMRQARATLLGHMPGWCPAIQPVGPYRPVEVVAHGPVEAGAADVKTLVDGTLGIVELSVDINGIEKKWHLVCGESSVPLDCQEGNRFHARLAIPDVRLWWPHTHGEPALHPLKISSVAAEIDLGMVGFRTVTCDSGPDGAGFALLINGVRVFCRGANWTNPDLTRLPGARQDYLPLMQRARDAGMNMLRLSGIMCREAPAFLELADELGILVWNDLNLGNFDYDFGDPRFRQTVLSEIDDLVGSSQGHPALAVVCGGSEMAQQAAMLSLPEEVWRQPFLTEDLPAAVAARRADVVVVPNSPWGGPLPFSTNAGVTHYFGVGAYQRPLEDARRADVRFASECLAFANLPQPERLPPGLLPGSAEWKRLVVRDLKADWDFEDTRDFYLGLLYGVDPARQRTENPTRYLALSTAVVGEVMEATFAEWRRAGSRTAGGLVWTLSDLGPGFGWGVIDHQGVPKPVWHALRRAFRPVQVALTDEGLNGLDVHLINDTQHAKQTITTLTAYGTDGLPVMDGRRALVLPPHKARKLTSTELFGIFFDITCAYRFGPPAHVATVARLEDEAGALLAEAFHFPLGREGCMVDPGLSVTVGRDTTGWVLDLSCQRLAQSVHIAAPRFEPSDDWFHLAPGRMRRIRLSGEGVPQGRVTTLNGEGGVAFDGGPVL